MCACVKSSLRTTSPNDSVIETSSLASKDEFSRTNNQFKVILSICDQIDFKSLLTVQTTTITAADHRKCQLVN